MGDRMANLEGAVAMLSAAMRVEALSSIYETEPMYNTAQPRFLNAVVEGRTDLQPGALLSFVKEVERRMGRGPGPRNSPRPLDIDLLLYDDVILTSTDLTLPHPRMVERAFVLAPLAEIAPDAVHPISRKSVAELWEAVLGKEGVERWGRFTRKNPLPSRSRTRPR
ncbi:MAG: 2-amino-4-hydroxy-6-hydroxymethyldihydropteridine diphosphokinase [Chloroflexi bacterium]|nr:2-amino-4-hydroxy-6-hydroxymethyldihydropteridine diphosphokinase [Chloroflexota bacterium]